MKTDQEIQKDVMDELKWEPYLNSTEIGVAVKHGVVTLTGTVDTYSKKISAESAAKRVAGVKAVAEEIEVKLLQNGKLNDTELAEVVVDALKRDAIVPNSNIKVSVEKNWVTLEGKTEWAFQRNAAREAVENLKGVAGVINNIKVQTNVSPVDLKRKISSAFHRNATVDSDNIDVFVEGDTVTLTGKVRSYAEKTDAENTAWLAPGVNKVENKIEIDFAVFADE